MRESITDSLSFRRVDTTLSFREWVTCCLERCCCCLPYMSLRFFMNFLSICSSWPSFYFSSRARCVSSFLARACFSSSSFLQN